MSIQVRNLSHIYSPGMPDEHKALENISFDIYDGECVAVIGHTGSGKSTLLQHLNGLLKPTEGSIKVGEMDITAKDAVMLEVRRRVGLVFQYPEYQLFEETVLKDVCFGPKNLGLSQDEQISRAKDAIGLVGLNFDDIKDKSPFELSGGQKRRVAIAGVIAMKPQVLVLDEPTAGLDPGAHAEILRMIEDIHDKEKNITIFVSHNMDDVARLADRVMVLDKGKLITMGKPMDVFSLRKKLKAIGLDVPPAASFMDSLVSAGCELDSNILTVKEAEERIYNYLTEGGVMR